MESRRKFLKQTALFSITCSGIGTLGALGGCVSVRYVKFTRSGDQLIVRRSELGKDSFVLISSEDLQAPIYLTKDGSDDFKAVYLLCTHKGCDVKPAGSILACPCHGSEFTRIGKLLTGPAEKDLKVFSTSIDEANIYIHLQS